MRPRLSVDASAVVERMCRRMHRRGPDAGGLRQDPEGGCVLGHRRLSIIDRDSRSDQPMSSQGGRFMIVFNGEIYNYRELKRGLESRGCRFRTSGDTEVILELIAREGLSAVKQLRGMFAFALWDKGERVLYLVRDPYGIKPLYYSLGEPGLLFASQVKGIVASSVVSRAIDPAGLTGFFLWGSVPEPWTIYDAVKAVPAGSMVTIQDLQVRKTELYMDISRIWQHGRDAGSAADLQEKVRAGILDTVRNHLIADVPVSVFLSGGLDSSVVAGTIAELKHPVEAITVGFEEFTNTPADEVPPARQIAQHFGIAHSVRMVGRREFEDDLPAILDAMDQPSIDGINTWFAAKAAAERGYKVVLSGIGGDELLAGYSTFRDVPRLARIGRTLDAVPGLRQSSKALFATAATLLHKPKLTGIPATCGSPRGTYYLSRGLFLAEDLAAVIGGEIAAEGLRRLGSPYGGAGECASSRDQDWAGCVASLESTRYLRNQLLRDSDWASMAHSLELRTPLVDHVLAESLGSYAACFLNGVGKRMLANSLADALPAAIVNRRKTGFGLPLGTWLGGVDSKLSVAGHGRPEAWGRRWARVVASQYHPATIP